MKYGESKLKKREKCDFNSKYKRQTIKKTTESCYTEFKKFFKPL